MSSPSKRRLVDDAEALDSSLTDPSVAPKAKKISTSQLFRSVRVVASAFFLDKESRGRALLLASALVMMMAGFAKLNVWFLGAFKDFQDALHERESGKFYSVLSTIVAVSVAVMPVKALRDVIRGSLALEWRRYLTRRLLAGYLGSSQAYYRLKLDGGGIDNPDQRIAQDTGEFTAAFLAFSGSVLQALMMIASQSAILFSISEQLFYFVVVYALFLNFGSFAVFGGPLTRLNRVVLGQEAALRFGLVRVREHAESVAFYRGSAFEERRCEEFLSDLLRSLYRRLCIFVLFDSLIEAVGTFAHVAPYLVIAGKYFAGDIDFGSMSESAAVLMGLQKAFGMLVAEMGAITSMGAQAVRIQQLWDALNEMSEAGPPEDCGEAADCECGELAGRAIRVVERPEPAGEAGGALLRLSDVTLRPPRGGAALVQRLSLELRGGEALLVCGPSGVGKSSLLRAIGGLWTSGDGTIERCAASRSFFMPQEPYVCLGTLRENATYPGGGADPSDAEVEGALGDVNLGHLVQRFGLDNPVDLGSILSGGERQRLGFARLLLRPALSFAVLDEATAALDEANESKVYGLMQRRVQCYVSVGHRQTLESFHTRKLVLDRLPLDGCSWSVQELGRGSPRG